MKSLYGTKPMQIKKSLAIYLATAGIYTRSVAIKYSYRAIAAAYLHNAHYS